MESLSDKLKSLGVQIGAGNVPRPKPRISYSMEDVLPGKIVATPYGDTYVVESYYGVEYQHGTIQLSNNYNLRVLSEWGHAPHLANSALSGFVFLDTETTGLGGGTGTFAFLVGLGHLTDNGFHLMQLLLRGPQEEPALLYLLNQYLSTFQAVVTYNGKSFDIPLLNARHVLNGFSSPFSSFDHLDLLPLARRLWKNRLPSRSLGNLEIEIIGAARTQEEVPGWLIPQIYFDYLHSGDARPLSGVLYHNGMDILSLAALFQHVAHLLNDPLGYVAPQSLDIVAVARLYEELGQYETAVQLYETSLQLGMPEPFFIETLERFANLYRRQGEWQKTIDLWHKAVEHHQVTACVELAKYYEHQQRDCLQALQWAEKAVQLVDDYIPGITARREEKKELSHRIDRLRRKLAAGHRTNDSLAEA